MFISTLLTLIFCKFSTFFVLNISSFSSKIFSILNNNSLILNRIFQVSNKIFEISNRNFLILNSNLLILNSNLSIVNKNFFVANSIFFVFSASLIKIFTSMFIDKLIIDLIAQKIWLFNALSVEIKLQRTFNYYFEFRFVKNFLMNFLIDLIVLFNYNFVVIKVVLILLVKVFLIDFHKSKIYKKTITNAQHKIN